MKKFASLFLVCVSAVMAVAAFCIAISQLLMSAFTKDVVNLHLLVESSLGDTRGKGVN